MIEATATVQVENSAVRVTRWDFPPRSETGPHRHEFDYVVVPVIGGILTIAWADGTTIESAITVGGSYNRDAGADHNVMNLSDSPVAFVEIELLEHGEG